MATISALQEIGGQPPSYFHERLNALPNRALAARVPDGLLLARWILESSSMEQDVSNMLAERSPWLADLRLAQREAIEQEYGEARPEDDELALLGCETAVSAIRRPELDEILAAQGLDLLECNFFEAKKIFATHQTRKWAKSALEVRCRPLHMLRESLGDVERQLTGHADSYLGSPFEKSAGRIVFAVAVQAGILPTYDEINKITS